LEASVEGGAEFYEATELDEDTSGYEVFTEATNLETLNQTLKERGYEIVNAELRWIANNNVEVTDPDQARSLLKMMDALDDLDDVQNVTANFDMANELVEMSVV
jgi:transcriptional/translational regulatory protein YebC/TACO1